MIEWKDEQLKAIKEEGNLLVSASAGSGKTTVMIERIMRLVKSGVDLSRLLIITFTRAAAADMKEKIIENLYKLMQNEPCSLYKKQIEDLPFAHICTIDSFCYDLYRRFFAEAHLEPGLKVMDENESSMLFSEAAEQAIEKQLQADDPNFFKLLDRFIHKRSLAKLKEEIININQSLANLLSKEDFLKTSRLEFEERSKAFFLHYYQKKLALLKERAESVLLASKACKVGQDLEDNAKYLLDMAANATKLKDFDSFLAYDFACSYPAISRRSKTQEEKIFISEYMNPLKGDIEKLYKKIADTIACYYKETEEDRQLLHTFFKLLISAENIYKQKKLASQVMDFADLSIYACEILADIDRARAVASQYDYIFVDEYQDTSVLQERIINQIQKADNLFMVGDVKQSIYGFRNAEPVIFINRHKQYESKKLGLNIPMNANFRSAKSILEFANAFFSPIMDNEFGGVDYDKDARLEAGLDIKEQGELPACEVMLFPKEKKECIYPKVYSVAEDDFSIGEADNRQAMYIAEKIYSIVDKEYIYDAKLKSSRKIKHSDIAILMRHRKEKGLFEALKLYNIPFLAFGFKNEQYFELGTLVNFLRLIDNFNNDIALAGVMQSFLGGFTRNDMLKIKKASNNEYFYQCVLNYPENNAIKAKIEKLLQSIEHYKERSYVKSIVDLLFEIMGDSGLDAYIMSKEKGSHEIAFINTFIFSLTEKEYAGTIPSFLRYYDEIFKGEGGCSAEKTEAISIMTTHNSKGLEFPVVFIANFQDGWTHTHDSKKDIFFDKELGISMKLFCKEKLSKIDSFRTEMTKLRNQTREREEELRIAYVAITRAKNHLFITGEDDESDSKSPALMNNPVQWLKYSAKTNKFLQDKIHIFTTLNQPAMQEVASAKAILGIPDLQGLDLVYPHSQATQTPQKYSVSKLNIYEQAEFSIHPIGLPFDKEVGTAYHKVLEHIDFGATSTLQIEQSLSKMAKEGLLSPELAAEIETDKIYNILNSDLWDKVRAGSYLREWSFMLYLPAKQVLAESTLSDKVLVQGVCDLVVLGNENFIIDYKVSNLDTQIIANKYRKQLQLYSLAVERIKKISISKKYIYIINRNKAIDID